jgi:hypothetical protein
VVVERRAFHDRPRTPFKMANEIVDAAPAEAFPRPRSLLGPVVCFDHEEPRRLQDPADLRQDPIEVEAWSRLFVKTMSHDSDGNWRS